MKPRRNGFQWRQYVKILVLRVRPFIPCKRKYILGVQVKPAAFYMQ